MRQGAEKKMADEVHFRKGAVVEVSSDEAGFSGAWYKATVCRCYPKKGRVSVQYDRLITESDESKPLTEVVDLSHVRPCPPVVDGDVADIELGDEVDAFYNDGWWIGNIKEFVGESGCVVYFSRSNEEIVFDMPELRRHRDWIDGKWVVSECNSSKLELKFYDGMMVEVSSDDEGFYGAWFIATIIEKIGKSKFLVEYQSLRTDDETELLREIVDSQHIRPVPPDAPKVKSFALLEEVDALYNDGWWVGVISKVLKDSKYIVYFRHSKEEMEFSQSDLRLHQDWINGNWVQASQALKLSD